MKHEVSLAWISLSLLVAGSSPLQAAWFPAAEFAGRQTGGTVPLTGATAGWEFTPRTDISITRVGLYDSHESGGFAQSHAIGVWRTDGTLLSSAFMPAGTQQPLEGNFRYVEVTPAITVKAYETCVIGATYTPFGGSDAVNNATQPVFGESIRFDAYREGPSGFQFPQGRDASGSTWSFGPSFIYTPAPPRSGDLSLSSTFSGGAYGLVGEPLNFRVTVTNGSALPVTNALVRISNPLPGGMTFERVSTSQGACGLEAGDLVCRLGTVPAETGALIQFGSTASASGSVSFTSGVTAVTPDPVPENNSATNTLTIYYPRFDVTSAISAFEGDPVEFRLSVSDPLTRAFTVHVATAGGTASAGTDYLGTDELVTFAPGETAKTIRISTVNDAAIEPDKTFVLQVEVPWYANTLSATGRIVDNDARRAPYVEDFESGKLSTDLWTGGPYVPPSNVDNSGKSHSGSRELGLVPNATGPSGPVSATLRVDVSGLTNVRLRLWARYGAGSAQSYGLGDTGIRIATDDANSVDLPRPLGSTSFYVGLSETHTAFDVPLDDILAALPRNPGGVIRITFYNSPRYYPPMFGRPGILYDHAMYLDDIQITGCPKDGAIHLIQSSAQSGTFRFHLPTCAGQDYRIEAAESLSDPEWTLLRAVSGDGYLETVEVPIGDAGPKFFRARTP